MAKPKLNTPPHSTAENPQAAWPFILCIGLGAFLLFQLQPMLARPLLPILGGTPMVWQVCMMVFQGLLLLGYSYAFWLNQRAPKLQWLLHGGLWAIALLTLFFPIPDLLQFDVIQQPAPWLIDKLLREIGLPFVALSATTPLLQRWASLHRPNLGKRAFRLYVASNLGSFGGLLSYPFLVEPWFTLAEQHQGLHFGFAVQFLLILFAIYTVAKAKPAAPVLAAETTDAALKPTRMQQATWVLYAAIGCSLMLGTTQHLSIDVASFPLLWIFPLALYLLSFTVVFGRGAAILPQLQRPSMLIIALPLFVTGVLAGVMDFKILLLLSLLGLFLQCLLVHGWLAAAQPAPRYASHYYLAISLGGVLAGIFNGLLAPLLFNRILEYELTMGLLLLLAAWKGTPRPWRDEPQTRVAVWLLLALSALVAVGWYYTRISAPFMQHFELHLHVLLCLLVVCVALYIWRAQWRWVQFVPLLIVMVIANMTYQSLNDKRLTQVRSWFSVMRVYEHKNRKMHTLAHGTTLHGVQFRAPGHERDVLSYYMALKQVWAQLPNAIQDKPYAVVGLGAGTLSCLTGGPHAMDLYEIDPEMVAIAENPDYFSYLRECGAQARMMVGDGRIMMQAAASHYYGMIVLDAFSSDAVPTHLLTREAVQLYLSKLSDDGVLAFNISSRHLDLAPVLGSIAKAEGLYGYMMQFRPNDDTPDGVMAADWVFLSRVKLPILDAIDTPVMRSMPLEDGGPTFLWRDDYGALWRTIR